MPGDRVPAGKNPMPVEANRIREHLYPESKIGGFARNDHRIVFFSRVNTLLRPEMTVLDYGAGRGKFDELETGFKREMTRIRGKVAKVIGVDPDPVVLENPELDSALVMEDGATIPMAAESVDLVVSWAVFEHVQDPQTCASEIDRVLKPGGWICVWTPNRWGYPALGARLVPEALHRRVLQRIAPFRPTPDSFPTVYGMNTVRTLEKLFPPERYEHLTYSFNGPPGYHGNKMALARFWQLYSSLVPPLLRTSLHVFMQKQPSPSVRPVHAP